MALRTAFLFAALVVACLVSTDAMMTLEDITPEKADVMFLCMDAIVCEIRHAYELKRMVSAASQEIFEAALYWLEDCYYLDTSDMQVFWDTYSDKVCNQSQDKRRECTKEILLNYANMYEDICETNINPYECQSAKDVMATVLKILEEYTETGDCNDPEEAAEQMEKEAEEKAREMAGEFPKEMPKQFPKPPGFGR